MSQDLGGFINAPQDNLTSYRNDCKRAFAEIFQDCAYRQALEVEKSSALKSAKPSKIDKDRLKGTEVDLTMLQEQTAQVVMNAIQTTDVPHPFVFRSKDKDNNVIGQAARIFESHPADKAIGLWERTDGGKISWQKVKNDLNVAIKHIADERDVIDDEIRRVKFLFATFDNTTQTWDELLQKISNHQASFKTLIAALKDAIEKKDIADSKEPVTWDTFVSVVNDKTSLKLRTLDELYQLYTNVIYVRAKVGDELVLALTGQSLPVMKGETNYSKPTSVIHSDDSTKKSLLDSINTVGISADELRKAFNEIQGHMSLTDSEAKLFLETLGTLIDMSSATTTTYKKDKDGKDVELMSIQNAVSVIANTLKANTAQNMSGAANELVVAYWKYLAEKNKAVFFLSPENPIIANSNIKQVEVSQRQLIPRFDISKQYAAELIKLGEGSAQSQFRWETFVTMFDKPASKSNNKVAVEPASKDEVKREREKEDKVEQDTTRAASGWKLNSETLPIFQVIARLRTFYSQVDHDSGRHHGENRRSFNAKDLLALTQILYPDSFDVSTQQIKVEYVLRAADFGMVPAGISKQNVEDFGDDVPRFTDYYRRAAVLYGFTSLYRAEGAKTADGKYSVYFDSFVTGVLATTPIIVLEHKDGSGEVTVSLLAAEPSTKRIYQFAPEVARAELDSAGLRALYDRSTFIMLEHSQNLNIRLLEKSYQVVSAKVANRWNRVPAY